MVMAMGGIVADALAVAGRTRVARVEGLRHTFDEIDSSLVEPFIRIRHGDSRAVNGGGQLIEFPCGGVFRKVSFPAARGLASFEARD